MQVSLDESSCNHVGERVGAAGREEPSEAARPRDAAQAGTRVGLTAPFEDVFSLDLFMIPSKVDGRKTAWVSLASSCKGSSCASPLLWELMASHLSCYLFSSRWFYLYSTKKPPKS